MLFTPPKCVPQRKYYSRFFVEGGVGYAVHGSPVPLESTGKARYTLLETKSGDKTVLDMEPSSSLDDAMAAFDAVPDTVESISLPYMETLLNHVTVTPKGLDYLKGVLERANKTEISLDEGSITELIDTVEGAWETLCWVLRVVGWSGVVRSSDGNLVAYHENGVRHRDPSEGPAVENNGLNLFYYYGAPQLAYSCAITAHKRAARAVRFEFGRLPKVNQISWSHWRIGRGYDNYAQIKIDDGDMQLSYETEDGTPEGLSPQVAKYCETFAAEWEITKERRNKRRR